MERPVKPCIICNALSTDNFCSKACENGNISILDTEKALKDYKYNKADTRIFFFDHSLSELFDFYTIELLKCFHAKNIKKQHHHWNRCNLLIKTILTKINKDFVSPEVLREYSKFIERLYKINARMWDCRSTYAKPIGVKDQAIAMQNYFDLDEERSILKNEIDIYCGLNPYNEKSYNE